MDENKRMIEYLRKQLKIVETSDGKTISAAQMLERFLVPVHLRMVRRFESSQVEKNDDYIY